MPYANPLTVKTLQAAKAAVKAWDRNNRWASFRRRLANTSAWVRQIKDLYIA